MVPTGDSAAVTFRISTRRHVVAVVGPLLGVIAAIGIVNVTLNRRWWDGLGLPVLLAALMSIFYWFGERRSTSIRLPLRLTGEGLELTGPSGGTVFIAWFNIAHASVNGRWIPYLLVDVVDPAQTRPEQILVPLMYMTPGSDVLRRELARRLPAPAG